jgi:hypothetical protein
VRNTGRAVTFDEACRRAAGRRHYNSLRRLHALIRRSEVVRFWGESKGQAGWQARAARALGVHRSTVSRDVQALLDELNRGRPCPLCGRGP